MKLNVPTTHEGARAAEMSPVQALRRSVMSCLLWEKEFYESGEEIAARIVRLAHEISATNPMEVGMMAIEARCTMNLRHVPLLLTSALAKHARGSVMATVVNRVVQRADELAELLAVHAKVNGVTPDKVKRTIPAGMKRGLAQAFQKFDAYALGKYNRPGAIKLRDVLFLCHAKPKDDVQAATWKRLIDGTLESPDTWEVNLSGGADKRETFERLIREGNLGYFALLRNLRNMQQAGCDMELVKTAILSRKNGADKVLPFRFIAAARACPQLEPALDQSLLYTLADLPVLSGKTAVLVDVSGSMNHRLSHKSDLTRMDAAAALGSIVNGDVRIFTFSTRLVEVPPRRGMAGVHAIIVSQPHSSTMLGMAIEELQKKGKWDRIIVVTDEQSHDFVLPPECKGYMINVGSCRNGVGYTGWTHIDGFSENVLRFIHEMEREETMQLLSDLRPQ